MEKEKQYRVLHHLLENPIFLENLARMYETLTDFHTRISYRIARLQVIRDSHMIPHRTTMKKICEAYRMILSYQKGIPDTRDIITIESELLSPYIPPIL